MSTADLSALAMWAGIAVAAVLAILIVADTILLIVDEKRAVPFWVLISLLGAVIVFWFSSVWLSRV